MLFILCDLLILVLIVFGLYMLIFQVIVPAVNGVRLFPDFRPNPLRDEVEATREMVGNMKEKNANLEKMEALLRQRSDLEKKIARHTDVDNPTEQK